MVLKAGAEDGPLDTDESAFGLAERANLARRTDNARWGDIVAESVQTPYAWVDLDGEWHDRWIGPSPEEATNKVPNNYDAWEVPKEEHATAFMKFLANLPADTWLVTVDYHH